MDSLFAKPSGAMTDKAVNFYKLMGHQQNAVHALDTHDWNTTRSVVISMPTGTGKTAIIAAAPFVLKSSNMLVVSPDVTLRDQMFMDLSGSKGQDSIFKKLEMLMYEDSKESFPSVMRPDVETLCPQNLQSMDIAVTNVDKFHTRENSTWSNTIGKGHFGIGHFGLIVVDEAHHLPSQTWLNIIAYFKESQVLFLTATPYRANGDNIVDLINEKEVRCKHIYRYSLEEAIRGRILKRPVFVETDDELNPNQAILNRIYELMFRENIGVQGLIITTNKYEAEKLKKLWDSLFSDARDMVKVHHSEIKNLPKQLQEFKEGRIKILIVVKMLIEGFDHPPINFVGIVRNVRSAVLFAQFVGRCLRWNRDIDTEDQAGYIITDKYYKQVENYDLFSSERFSRRDDEELEE